MSSCCPVHEGAHEIVIEARGLSVRLGDKQVLQNVNLTIQRGEAIALIGPNGAGKTTLLKALLGLIPIASGEIKLLGSSSVNDVSARIGYIPQRLVADASFALSVREFLGLPLAKVHWWSSRKKVDALLEPMAREIGIQSLLSHSVAELSGGQFQRVMIAYALLRQPEILFLDVPTSGVGAPGEEDFYEMIGKIHCSRHLTVVLVSHDLSMVYKHTSRVFALNNQTICCHGTPEEVLAGQNLARVFGREFSCYQHHHP